MLASTWHRSGAKPASLKCYSRSLEITVPGFGSSLTWETLAFLMLMGVCCIPERPNSSTTSIGSCNGKVQSSSNVWVILPSPPVSAPQEKRNIPCMWLSSWRLVRLNTDPCGPSALQHHHDFVSPFCRHKGVSKNIWEVPIPAPHRQCRI